MKREDKLYRRYLEILREELTPAMGCTEPIAVAYAAAESQGTAGRNAGECAGAGQRKYHQKCQECDCTKYRRPPGNSGGRSCGNPVWRADSALEVLAEATEGDIAGLDPFLEKTDIPGTVPGGRPRFRSEGISAQGAEDSLCPHYGPSYQNHADGEERQNAFGSDAEGDRGWNTGAKGSLLHGADL